VQVGCHTVTVANLIDAKTPISNAKEAVANLFARSNFSVAPALV